MADEKKRKDSVLEEVAEGIIIASTGVSDASLSYVDVVKADRTKSTLEAEKAAAEAKRAAEAKAAIAAQHIKPITGKTVEAPLPGRILEVCVKVGDTVKRGQRVVILDAMKMENNITTDYAGTIKQVIVNVGDAVPANAILVEVE